MISACAFNLAPFFTLLRLTTIANYNPTSYFLLHKNTQTRPVSLGIVFTCYAPDLPLPTTFLIVFPFRENNTL